MAPRFPRRRGTDEPPEEPDEDVVHLDGTEHAWWAQRTHEELLVQRPAADGGPDPTPRDVLAEHFGEDWRTTFQFDPIGERLTHGGTESDLLAQTFGEDWRTTFDLRPTPPEDVEADADVVEDAGSASGPVEIAGTDDPYELLEIDPSASWEDIVDAHRKMARAHHPDRLAGRPAAEIEAGEEMIRRINAAYSELRVRRGR